MHITPRRSILCAYITKRKPKKWGKIYIHLANYYHIKTANYLFELIFKTKNDPLSWILLISRASNITFIQVLRRKENITRIKLENLIFWDQWCWNISFWYSKQLVEICIFDGTNFATCTCISTFFQGGQLVIGYNCIFDFFFFFDKSLFI